MNVHAQIAGMPRLLRKLKVMPQVAQQEVRAVMAQQADELIGMMRRLAPKGATGNLKESIGWTWGNKIPKGAMAIATAGKGNLTITIYAGSSKAYYARWVEFGTQAHALGRGSDVSRRRGRQTGPMHPGSTAQPFFFPSWRAMRKRIRKALRKASRDAARRVASQ